MDCMVIYSLLHVVCMLCFIIYYLPSLIADRREQSNFQLVVITHNPEFVELMGRSDHVDDYLMLEREG